MAVTNSLAQLGRLAKVDKVVDPIASLDEYKFFRSRYPLGDQNETALLFLSDATIRRWCSPRWRIASARRTFTAAALAELTAANVKPLVAGNVQPGPIHTDLALVDAGELRLTSSGVSSSTQGTLEWMTPIVELPIEKVTKAEAEAYNQWRDNYHRNWRWVFDPIALRIGVNSDKLSGDLTVMPLIAASEYNEFISISRGAQIKPNSGDPHAALAHVALAINTKSERIRQWGSMATAFAPQARIEPFGWLGSSVALYVDDDPFWKQINEEEFLRHAWGKSPIALHAEVSSSLKLTAFLTALRAFIEQTAPGMTTWESLTYRDEPYVCIKPTDARNKDIGEDVDVALYYAPSADSLTVSFSETVLQHAIDRRLEPSGRPEGTVGNQEATAKKDGVRQADHPPGRRAVAGLESLFAGRSQPARPVDAFATRYFQRSGLAHEAAMQVRSWGNIPILNEWKRLFPDEDPVKVHQRLWHTQLVCPGGGKYVWNDEWKTMESTGYGHPGQPKTGPKVPAPLGQFQTANFGLTFEEQGLARELN